jgi:transposase-like protein
MRHHFYEREAEANVSAPTACPVCKSKDLTTTSKNVTSATYWRCTACGEVWNVERLEAGSRYSNRYSPRYR